MNCLHVNEFRARKNGNLVAFVAVVETVLKKANLKKVLVKTQKLTSLLILINVLISDYLLTNLEGPERCANR